MSMYPYTPLLYRKSGVYRGMPIFVNFAQNIDCGYSLEPPPRGRSNVYPHTPRPQLALLLKLSKLIYIQ